MHRKLYKQAMDREIEQRQNELDRAGDPNSEAAKEILTKLRILHRNLNVHLGCAIPERYQLPPHQEPRSRLDSLVVAETPDVSQSEGDHREQVSQPQEMQHGNVGQLAEVREEEQEENDNVVRWRSAAASISISRRFIGKLRGRTELRRRSIALEAKRDGNTDEKPYRDAQMEAILVHDENGTNIDEDVLAEEIHLIDPMPAAASGQGSTDASSSSVRAVLLAQA